jgi:hypothetical protein
MSRIKKSIIVALFLLLTPFIKAGKEPQCPEGTEPVWMLNPATKEWLKMCTTCSRSGNSQNQKVETIVYTDSYSCSGSGSRSDSGGNDFMAQLKNRLPSLPTAQPGTFFAQSWKDMLLSKETLYTALSMTAAWYTYCYYQIRKAVWLMQDKNAWCNWKKDEVSFQELCSMPRKQLAEELLQKIQTRYLNPKNPADYVGPLNIFLEDYRAELCTFRTYFRIAKLLKKFHITHFFPIVEKEIAAIKERIERLSYLKSVFFDWTTEYKTIRCLKDPN